MNIDTDEEAKRLGLPWCRIHQIMATMIESMDEQIETKQKEAIWPKYSY